MQFYVEKAATFTMGQSTTALGYKVPGLVNCAPSFELLLLVRFTLIQLLWNQYC